MRHLWLALLLSGCPAVSIPDAGLDAGAVDSGVLMTVDAGADGGTDAGVAGLGFFPRLAGLWSGPGSMTPLGNFPVMFVDFRGVGDGFLFGQADIDATNTLRFGFSIETYGGVDVLAYRNGGYFQGVLRDSRTKLVESDESVGRYRFCSVDRGCAYLDALFTFSTADRLVFDVKVRGNPHLFWSAQRVEPRTLPAPYPATLTSKGDGSAPWPTMGTLSARVNWTQALAADADVWVLATTTACFPTFGCTASRSVKVRALAGATSATVQVPAFHAGTYKLTGVVDRDSNLAATRAPSSGDSVAVDSDLVMGTQDQSAMLQALYTVP
ncbi:MAG: hypothetical protein JNJ54_34760 [Myxococcaceae bacterium]|nr:hypothetical protein [Myxococcaceae bacterium]